MRRKCNQHSKDSDCKIQFVQKKSTHLLIQRASKFVNKPISVGMDVILFISDERKNDESNVISLI
jgi:hypothetical protein